MKSLGAALFGAGLVLAATPAFAQAIPARSELPAHLRPTAREAARTIAPQVQVPQAAVPAQLGAAERESYRAIFADLRAESWTGAAARIEAMRDGPLRDVARAMLFSAPGSPRVELGPLMDLLQRAPDLPQAAVPAQLGAAERESYRSIFADLRAESWTGAAGRPGL